MAAPTRTIRTAVLVTHFPKISETFVLAQIIGLLDAGHKVTVFPKGRWHDPFTSRDIERYGLLDRTVHPPEPASGMFRRIRGLLRLLATGGGLPPRRKILRLMAQLGVRETVEGFHVFLPLLEKGLDQDLYYCHFGPNGLRAVYLKRAGLINGKIVTVFHGYDVTRLVEKHGVDYYRPLFRYGDLFLTISERWKDRLISLGCDPDKILVHRLGVDPDRFRVVDRSMRKPGPLRLFSVARLVEKKGIEYALRALVDLKDEVDVVYKVAGGGPLLEELSRLARELGVSDRVEFLGPQPDERIQVELEEADVFLAPSVTSSEGDQEGIPVAIMEAMAVGLPVISTWHSGIPELVKDEDSGFLVPERDPEAIARKIEALEEDPGMRSRMGARGREIVEAEYDLRRSIRRLVGILEDIQDQ